MGLDLEGGEGGVFCGGVMVVSVRVVVRGVVLLVLVLLLLLLLEAGAEGG